MFQRSRFQWLSGLGLRGWGLGWFVFRVQDFFCGGPGVAAGVKPHMKPSTATLCNSMHKGCVGSGHLYVLRYRGITLITLHRTKLEPRVLKRG